MVTSFSVAVRQPKKQGQDQPAYWVKVECWGKTAQYAADYLKKGDSVFCVGTVTLEEFNKRDGTVGYANVLKNANVEKFSSRDGDAPAYAPAAAAPAPVAQQSAQSLAAATGGQVLDDEIPF
jgi:single-strand DNA-binding protein